jgi:uncharacterized protein YfaS (alpha-2-macroglobulin family)
VLHKENPMKLSPILLLLLSTTAFAGNFELQVTPQGIVKSPHQVRATFTEAMVAMGNVNATAPFDFQCPKPGKGMWEDSKTWILEFDSEVGGGITCSFTLKNNLKSVAGNLLKGQNVFTFNTGGPNIVNTRPYAGYGVETDQAFLLELDAEPDMASLEGKVYFQASELLEKNPAKILDQASLAKVLEAVNVKKKPESFYLLVQAARPFPEDTSVTLVWDKGIKTKTGVASTLPYEHNFRTSKPFTAKFTCMRENVNEACNPISASIGMEFSAPIAKKDAEKIRLKSGKQEWKPDLGKGKKGTISNFQFAGLFPAKAKLRVEIPAKLKDETGRTLTNAHSFPLEVATSDYPPLVKFAAEFGIVEASDPVLPVTLRNVEPKLSGLRVRGAKLKLNADNPVEIFEWISREGKFRDGAEVKLPQGVYERRDLSIFGKADQGKLEHFELPKPNGKEAFEVVGIPLEGKGLHVIELESPKLGSSLIESKHPMLVHSTVLVTNLAVHFKLGEGQTLTWVTQLSDGKPVSGAEVKIYRGDGVVLGSGKTDLNGLLKIEKEPAHWKAENKSSRNELYAFATKGDDFAFVSTDWTKGLEPWRFSLSSTYNEKQGALAHTVFDRTLFRAGEKVHMKHFLREKYLRGLRGMAVPPHKLVIKSAVGQLFVYPVQFDKNGHGISEWTIPKEAKLGTYRVYLVSSAVKASKVSAVTEENDAPEYFSPYGEHDFEVGDFRVEEFRLPALKGAIEWGKFSGSGVEADIAVQYLAGGGAAKLPTLVRGRWEKAEGKSFSDWEDFTFANGGIKTGRTSRNYSDFEEEDYSSGTSNSEKSKNFVDIENQKFELDSNGTHRFAVKGAPEWETGAMLRVEAEFKDPNGEIVTVSRTREDFPGNALVGIKTDGWFSTQDKVKFKIAAVDPQGKPLRGRKVSASWLERTSFSHRKKILGGFYAYENFDDVTKLGSACSGKTDDHGVLDCEGKAPASGNLMLVAEMNDSPVKANRELWVSGKDNFWFSQGDSDRIDVIPEKKRYEPGEKAKFQVRMPFQVATALVSVERQGITQTFVQEITAKNPSVEVPVLGEYAPNIFVSVLVVRGRVEAPKPEAIVDLAKPAFKFGIAEVEVGWKHNELKVKVETPKPEYHVRQKVTAKIQVSRAEDGKPAGGGEVILAVVDESLLELKNNTSWKLLEAMMRKHPYLVHTSTSQGLVIGKRHYGLKALPAGGGGGHMTSRELFDTLIFWNPKVKLDAKGSAEVEFTLNDSLTSFRIVAIASEDLDKFGTGYSSVRSTQDLMVFSGVSPVARSGDKTNPEITVRNSTKNSMQVKVKGSTDSGVSFAEKNFQLAGGESQKLSWDFEVPFGKDTLAYTFEVSGGVEKDKISVKQKVLLPLNETVLQATLEQLDKKLEIPVQLPENAVRDGSLVVKLDKSLLSGLTGVKSYMELYPYSCLEQQTSKAVALRNKKSWEEIARRLPSFQAGDGLFKYFPESIYGSEVLTAYILQITNEAGYEIPAEARTKAIEALKMFVSTGKNPHESYWNDLYIRQLKITAMEALSRYAAFDKSWVAQVKKDFELWPTITLLEWWNILQKNRDLPLRNEEMAKVEKLLKAKIYWKGTVAAFKDESVNWWMMNSGDSAALRLLLVANEQPGWKSDIGRLMRGTLARQKQGAWDLTTANAWGVLATEKFAAVHEKDAVAGKSFAELGKEKKELDWKGVEQRKALVFPWSRSDSKLEITHTGSGKPWAFVYAKAPLRLKDPIFKGYHFTRTITAVDQKKKGQWSVGDVYRVKIVLEAPADMSWVVVNDPIPASATILGSGLGGDSALLAAGTGSATNNWWSTQVERGQDSYRLYYEFLPKGKSELEYVVRLNAAGKFQLPNSRVEAMYSPEMYGEAPNVTLDVAP